jgi:hypothetical protein
MSRRSKKLFVIAHRVREEFKNELKKAYDKRADIYQYNERLAGYCGAVSEVIVRVARANGINASYVGGDFVRPCTYSNDGKRFDGHCWVVYGDKFVDATATQFGVKKLVNVVGKKNPNYKLDKVFNTVEKIKRNVDSWNSDGVRNVIETVVKKVANVD